MPKTTDELPDVDPETLNAMIRDLARELGRPWWATSPDLVALDHIPQHVYGYNTGFARTGLDMYKEGQKWRRKIIAELKRRPDWIAQWRADAEMDRRVEELCARKGLRFRPHECPPWQVRVDDELPPQRGSDDPWTESARLAQRLRRQLEAEIKAEDA